MGRWLAKFSGDMPKSLTAKADIVDEMGSVSALSPSDIEVSAKNTTSQPADEPTPPLAPGWLVCYRDGRGILCGGCDDRQHGTVQECRWTGNGWTLWLTDGERLPLSAIRSVGKTDSVGQVVSAWMVREHGYDGTGGRD